MKQRRTLLKSGLLAGAAALTGGGLYFYFSGSEAREIASQLGALLEQPEQAARLGASVLASEPGQDGLSLAQKVDKLLAELEIDRSQYLTLETQTVLSKLHERVTQDFIAERISLVDGWVLSRTEADLCALLATPDWS